jgi:hypothetical protein
MAVRRWLFELPQKIARYIGDKKANLGSNPIAGPPAFIEFPARTAYHR